MTAIAGCDVSAGVVSKTWCGPRGVQQPDGPGDHYASHRLLSTVAPWRQSRSLGSPCGVGCQSPSLALAWSLPDSHFSPLWFNFLGSSVLKGWRLTVSSSPREEGGEGVTLKIRCRSTFSFLGFILILDLDARTMFTSTWLDLWTALQQHQNRNHVLSPDRKKWTRTRRRGTLLPQTHWTLICRFNFSKTSQQSFPGWGLDCPVGRSVRGLVFLQLEHRNPIWNRPQSPNCNLIVQFRGIHLGKTWRSGPDGLLVSWGC